MIIKPFTESVLSRIGLDLANRNYVDGVTEVMLVDDKTEDAQGYTLRDRKMALLNMSHACSVFYALANASGCHAFHELTAIISMYFQACLKAEAEGRLWLAESECAGNHATVLSVSELHYLDEKVRCMFGLGLDLRQVART